MNAVSPAGAIGVMQLEPATAAALGVNPNNLVENIDGGVRYLSQLLRQFGGDVAQAVAAYDWGPGNVSRALSANGAGWLANAPAETKAYVQAITGQTPESTSTFTIDPSTGLLVPDTGGDGGGGTAPTDPAQILLLAGVGLAAYLLGDLFFGSD